MGTVLHKLGVLTVEALGSVSSAGKLQQDMCGINKKYKLELKNPTADDVKHGLSQPHRNRMRQKSHRPELWSNNSRYNNNEFPWQSGSNGRRKLGYSFGQTSA